MVKEPLDFESLQSHHFNVTAKDGSIDRPLQTQSAVEIIVTDYNDNPPVITNLPDIVKIKENEVKKNLITLQVFNYFRS